MKWYKFYLPEAVVGVLLLVAGCYGVATGSYYVGSLTLAAGTLFGVWAWTGPRTTANTQSGR